MCASCGLTYDAFRSGLTYDEVWTWGYNADIAQAEQKSSGVVLRRMARLKRQMWTEHTKSCRKVNARTEFAFSLGEE